MASRHPSASARLNSAYACNNVWTSKEEFKASSYRKIKNPAFLGFAAEEIHGKQPIGQNNIKFQGLLFKGLPQSLSRS